MPYHEPFDNPLILSRPTAYIMSGSTHAVLFWRTHRLVLNSYGTWHFLHYHYSSMSTWELDDYHRSHLVTWHMHVMAVLLCCGVVLQWYWGVAILRSVLKRQKRLAQEKVAQEKVVQEKKQA